MKYTSIEMLSFLGSENHTESHAPVVDGLEESICPVERSRNFLDVLLAHF